MTVIETMSLSLAVIASDIGGPKDIIEPRRNGLLVPSDDPVTQAVAIQRLIQEPSLFTEMGLAAIETFLENL